MPTKIRSRLTVPAVASMLVLLQLVACEDDEAVSNNSPSNNNPARCLSSQVVCNGDCVDLASDPDNCGVCGLACDSTTVCSRGSCKTACDAAWGLELSSCGRSCVDLKANHDHCGTCGNNCGEGICSHGQCAVSCDLGADVCGGACFDLNTSAMHCGSCETSCTGSSGGGGNSSSVSVCVQRSCVNVPVPSNPGSCTSDGGTLALTQVCKGMVGSDYPASACCETEEDAGCSYADKVLAWVCTCGNGLCFTGSANGGCVERSDWSKDVCGTGNTDVPCDGATETFCGGECCDISTHECNEDVCVEKNEPFCQTEGEECGSGKVCDASHECVDGCYIGGAHYAHGAHNPSNNCQLCTESKTNEWSGQNPGFECGSGKVCTASHQCVNGCYIGGAQYSHGAHNPSNSCQLCTESKTNEWLAENQGFECGSGKVCNASHQCVDGCYIDGALLATGARNPSNKCENCAAKSTSVWTAAAGTTCDYDGGAMCDSHSQCIKPPTISAGKGHACGVTSTGKAMCWGLNTDGQVGNNTLTTQRVPIEVSWLGSDVTAISAGGYHTCALTSAGEVKCWGRNSSGQLGDASTVSKQVPTDVNTLGSGVTAISAGESHTCAITALGGAMCWGNNSGGRLGDNSTINKHVPTPVSGLSTGVVEISAGVNHTCARTSTGEVFCWGFNGNGKVGEGMTGSITMVPTQVHGLDAGVTAISAGPGHTCAITSTGGVMCWGGNGYGQLGDGSTNEKNVPTPVSGLGTAVTKIAAGDSHTCAVTVAGGVLCWGRGAFGQLGNNLGTDSLVPTPVTGLDTGVIAISSDDNHTCALTTGVEAMCWGANLYGQIGDHTTSQRMAPVNVLGFP